MRNRISFSSLALVGMIVWLALSACESYSQGPDPDPSPSPTISAEIIKGTQLLPLDGGTRAIFTSPTGGKFWIVVACSRTDGLSIVRQEIELRAGEAATLTLDSDALFIKWEWFASTPPVPPAPPNTLEGRVQLWKSQVPGDDTDSEAKRLSYSFDSVAAQVAATSFVDIPAVVKALKVSNKEALSAEARQRWVVAFFTPLNAEFDRLKAAGGLKDPKDYVPVFRRVATGLK